MASEIVGGLLIGSSAAIMARTIYTMENRLNDGVSNVSPDNRIERIAANVFLILAAMILAEGLWMTGLSLIQVSIGFTETFKLAIESLTPYIFESTGVYCFGRFLKFWNRREYA